MSSPVIYLTRLRLMRESVQSINDHAAGGEAVPRRVCAQLLTEPTHYSLWHVRHEQRMGTVADARRRERQILALRAFSIQQVHRSALVRYLRDFRIVGAARDQTLADFYGVIDPREAAVIEHRDYLLAASSQICATDVLELVGDDVGVQLLRNYELAYGQFFSMFCDYSRAKRSHQSYLLTALLPEVRGTAARLRGRMLDPSSIPMPQLRLAPRATSIVRPPPASRLAPTEGPAGAPRRTRPFAIVADSHAPAGPLAGRPIGAPGGGGGGRGGGGGGGGERGIGDGKKGFIE